jgi:alpha-tubulin suppressor-like RCC1 family protein
MSEKQKYNAILLGERIYEVLDNTQLELREHLNKVYVCGANNYGQLGLGDKQNRNVLTQIPNIKVKQISTGEGHMIMIDENNAMLVCGNNKKWTIRTW